MARIYYALCGEGRGHATRARAMVEELRADHQVVLYTYDKGAELLRPVYAGTDVEVRTLPGLHFAYGAAGALHYSRTLLQSVPYLMRLERLVQKVARELENDPPDLIITDFEPLLPRAAERLGIPFISLDHQHFLQAYDLSMLPARLQMYARFMQLTVDAFYSGQIRTIVSSFYRSSLKPAYRHVAQVGTLLRPEVVEAEPSEGSHLVAYVRRQAPEPLLRSLRHAGTDVRVYGLGARERSGNLRFMPVDPFRFVDDLASCRALVCTAGNQLVGEALYLHKPVLAMPEPGNYEQDINGYFLRMSGCGHSVTAESLCELSVRRFLSQTDALRENIEPHQHYGNPMAVSIVLHHLREIEAGKRVRAPRERRHAPAFAPVPSLGRSL